MSHFTLKDNSDTGISPKNCSFTRLSPPRSNGSQCNITYLVKHQEPPLTRTCILQGLVSSGGPHSFHTVSKRVQGVGCLRGYTPKQFHRYAYGGRLPRSKNKKKTKTTSSACNDTLFHISKQMNSGNNQSIQCTMNTLCTKPLTLSLKISKANLQ